MKRTIESQSVVVWKSSGHILILTAPLLAAIHFPFIPRLNHSFSHYELFSCQKHGAQRHSYATFRIFMSNVPLILPEEKKVCVCVCGGGGGVVRG